MWDFQQRGGEFRRSGFGHTGIYEDTFEERFLEMIAHIVGM